MTRRRPLSGRARPALLALGVIGLVLVGAEAGRSAEARGDARPGSFAESLVESRRHLELRRSAPAADSVVPSPPEVRVWFTEVPLYQTTSIRLLNAVGELVPTGATTRAPDDGRVYYVEVQRPLPPGPYTVAWRTLAADGHAIAAEFRFTVRE